MACVNKPQLQKLQNKFKVDTKIGYHLGISRQAVHQLRIKFGIKPVKDRLVARNKEIVAAFKKVTTKKSVAVARLCQRYKLSISQVYRIIKKPNHHNV